MLINFAVDEFGRSCQLVHPTEPGCYGKYLRIGQSVIVSVGDDDQYVAVIVRMRRWVFKRPTGNYVLVAARTLSRRVGNYG